MVDIMTNDGRQWLMLVDDPSLLGTSFYPRKISKRKWADCPVGAQNPSGARVAFIDKPGAASSLSVHKKSWKLNLGSYVGHKGVEMFPRDRAPKRHKLGKICYLAMVTSTTCLVLTPGYVCQGNSWGTGIKVNSYESQPPNTTSCGLSWW